MIVFRNLLTRRQCAIATSKFRKSSQQQDLPGRFYAKVPYLDDLMGHDSYVVRYNEGSWLPPHIDAKGSSFYVLSIMLYGRPVDPIIWPLYIGDKVAHLNIGDGVLYHSNRVHWRDTMPTPLKYVTLGVCHCPVVPLTLDTPRTQAHNQVNGTI